MAQFATDHDQAESILQDRCRQLVQREVLACVSTLVSTLARSYGEGDSNPDLRDLTERAFELATPIPDYQSAAEEEGWTVKDGVFWHEGEERENDEIDPAGADAWQELCDDERIEPHDREVFEHWTISSWLADKLREHGEKIDDDFAGLIVWARTTTGQAILLDHVIRQIVLNLHSAEA